MAGQTKEPGRGCLSRLILGILGLAVFAVVGTVILVAVKPQAVRQFLRGYIEVKPARARPDLTALVAGRGRLILTLGVGNRLPVGATVDHLTFDVFLNGTVVGSGVQSSPRMTVPGWAHTEVQVEFEVDAVRLRTALARTAQDGARSLAHSVMEGLKARRPAPPAIPSAKGLIRIAGTATIRLLVGDLELPMDREVEFEREK